MVSEVCGSFFNLIQMRFTPPRDPEKHKRNFVWGTVTSVHDYFGHEPAVEGADCDVSGVRGSCAVAVVPCGGLGAEPDAQCCEPLHSQDGGGAWGLAVRAGWPWCRPQL